MRAAGRQGLRGLRTPPCKVALYRRDHSPGSGIHAAPQEAGHPHPQPIFLLLSGFIPNLFLHPLLRAEEADGGYQHIYNVSSVSVVQPTSGCQGGQQSHSHGVEAGGGRASF